MADRSHLSIGEVLSLLRDEFPDVTISKIRFLESQGLVDPERTPSGYRKFYEHDVERLKWILRQQREHFLPLKVIRGRLSEQSEGEDRFVSEPVSVTDPEPPRPSRHASRPAPAAAPTEADGELDLTAPEVEPGTLDLTGAGAGAGATAADRVGAAAAAEAGAVGPVADGEEVSMVPAGGPGTGPARAGAPWTGPGGGPAGTFAAGAPGRAGRRGPTRPPESRVTGGTGRPGPIGGQPADTNRGGPGRRGTDSSEGGGDPGELGGRPGPGAPAGTGADVEGRGAAPNGSTGARSSAAAGPAATTPSIFAPLHAAGPATDPAPAAGVEDEGAPVAEAGGADAAPGREGAATAGRDRPGPGRPRPTSAAYAADEGDTYTADELAAEVGATVALVTDLKQYGLISPHAMVAGAAYYDTAALAVARAAAEFSRFGVEVRHLRSWRNAADREADLFQQIVLPLLRQRNPQARRQAADTLGQLAQLGEDLRAALVERAIRDIR